MAVSADERPSEGIGTPLPQPNAEFIALIGETPAHERQLILRSISKENSTLIGADQTATIPSGAMPVDVLFSTVYRPNSLLVLREDLSVLAFDVAFDAEGKAKLIVENPTTVGDFGDEATLGAGTVLAEAPGAVAAEKEIFLGIGSTSGTLVQVTGIIDRSSPTSPTPSRSGGSWTISVSPRRRSHLLRSERSSVCRWTTKGERSGPTQRNT